MKCSFLDYIQLLMIGRAIQAMKVDRNAKKAPFPTKVAQNDLEQPILCGKKKTTMIQGNFYERLHFYMDSCAISPMASL